MVVGLIDYANPDRFALAQSFNDLHLQSPESLSGLYFRSSRFLIFLVSGCEGPFNTSHLLLLRPGSKICARRSHLATKPHVTSR